jgi:NAD(P)-dependent dehydrogenase (short-subunit alcohol dehydrogenase family)
MSKNNLNHPPPLVNYSVVVVGGTGKVGRSIVDSLLLNGATVVSVSRHEAMVESYSSDTKNFYWCTCDVSTNKGVESLLNFLSEKKIKPSAIVNSMSYRPQQDYLSESVEKWDEFIYKNSRATYMLYKIFAEIMKKNGGGSIVNVSSIYAVVSPDPSLYEDTKMGTEPDYPFIKGGTISLTNYFASYYGKYSVRFNSVILGGVFNGQDSKFVDRYIDKVPLGRMANPNDICGVINLLVSDSSTYITGAIINVDGGFSIR